MALTVQDLQSERDKILAQMGNPSQVSFEGRSLTYRPQVDLEAALKRVDAELAAMQAPSSRQFVIQTNRGI